MFYSWLSIVICVFTCYYVCFARHVFVFIPTVVMIVVWLLNLFCCLCLVVHNDLLFALMFSLWMPHLLSQCDWPHINQVFCRPLCSLHPLKNCVHTCWSLLWCLQINQGNHSPMGDALGEIDIQNCFLWRKSLERSLGESQSSNLDCLVPSNTYHYCDKHVLLYANFFLNSCVLKIFWSQLNHPFWSWNIMVI